METLARIHRHFGELLLILPIAIIIVAFVKGKTPLPRIYAVLLDIQLVLGAVTFALYTKSVNLLHLVCMIAAVAVAHIVAKRDNQAQVAIGFAVVLALLVLGYLFQKQFIKTGAPMIWTI